MRRWYCPEGWESRRLPPLGGDDGQEYGYFLPPPPLPFLHAQSFLIPSFPFPVLPSSFLPPFQTPPALAAAVAAVPSPFRPGSGLRASPSGSSSPSLRPRKPEANARVASTCFLEGKSTADPLGTLLQGMPVCFLHGKSTYCRQPFMQGNVVYNISRIIIFRTRLAKPRKPFKRKYPVGMRQSVEAICILDFKTSQTFLAKPGTGRLNSCLCNLLFHK